MLVQEVLEAKHNVQLWTKKEAEAKEVLRQFDSQREEEKLKQLEMELKEENVQKEALRRSNWINEQQRIMELEKQLKEEREARKDIESRMRQLQEKTIIPGQIDFYDLIDSANFFS